MTAHPRRHTARTAIIAVTMVLCAAAAFAQSARPPIPGATGVIVPEGAGDGATDAIIEGTRQVLGALGSLGGRNEPATGDPLKALELGATVVVRYNASTAAPSDGSESQAPLVTEGRVIELDRRGGVVVVRLADRTTERLRLAPSRERDPAASGGTAKDEGETISLSYVDAKGDRVVILFRKAS
jgi:hypothetical protein